jgi:hypothetical protein
LLLRGGARARRLCSYAACLPARPPRSPTQERELHELRVALLLEAEDAFGDVMGSRGRVSSFVAARLRALGDPLAEQFARYASLSSEERERAVLAATAAADGLLARLPPPLNAHQRAAREHAATAADGLPSLAALLTEVRLARCGGDVPFASIAACTS